MKQYCLALVVVCLFGISQLTYAHGRIACEGDLANIMEETGKHFTAIEEAIDLDDQASLDAATDRLIAALEKAKSYQPMGFDKMTAEKRAKRLAGYKKALDRSIEHAQGLKNPDTRSTAFKKLKRSRKKGHRGFKRCKGDH